MPTYAAVHLAITYFKFQLKVHFCVATAQAVLMRDMRRFLTFGKLELSSLKVITGTPDTPVKGNIHTNFGFSMFFFVFRLSVRMEQTARETDARDT